MTDPIEAQHQVCRQLLEQHGRWLRTVIGSRINDASAVDDVFQEVALALIRVFPEVPRDLAPWLRRVAVRQSLLHRRRTGRRSQREQEKATLERDTIEADPTSSPLEWILGEEQRRTVREALDRLGTTDRELLLLKHSENWSYQQMADHLGVSITTIEYRLLKARRQLRRELRALELTEVVSQ